MKKIAAVLFCMFTAVSVFAMGNRENTSGPLRFGIMGDTNVLPLILANQEGYFELEGVQVKLIQFNNAQERDAAIQAGQVDGATADILAAALLTGGGYDFKITSLTNDRFGIVASPQSGITRLQDLRGKRIGLSANTIIQYTVDAQLDKTGVPVDSYEVMAFPNQNIRLNMVMDGTVDAGGFPDPFLTMAVVQGATLLSTTESAGINAGVMLFSKRFLDNRLEDVKAFYRAYYKAAMEINANPDNFRSYLVEHVNFPEVIRDTFKFVTFTKPTMTAESEIVRVLGWLNSRDLIRGDLSPADLTDGRAIGEWSN